jgi:hypothetical protein
LFEANSHARFLVFLFSDAVRNIPRTLHSAAYRPIQPETKMVYYFTSNVVDPPAFIYVGKDKVESMTNLDKPETRISLLTYLEMRIS